MADVRIDSSGLTYTQFLIPEHTGFLEGANAPTIHLEPGVYGFQQMNGSVANFTFEVTPGGLIDYDVANDEFLDGRGTTTLTVRGFTITLDGRALSHDLYPMVLGVWLSRDSTHEMTLIPASGYGFQAPAGISADFSFALDVNGQVVVEPRLAGFAQVAGRTLTISGYRITLDGRALSHDLYPMVLGVWLSRDSTHEMTLIPASGYGFQAPAGISADFSFALDVNGQVVVEPRLAGFAQVAGRTLTISGYRITLDGRALSHDLYPMVLGVWLSRDSTHEMTLIPASGYGFQAPAGISADFSFALDVNGQVVVEPRLAGFAQVAGRTLTISGYRITLDGRALSHDLYPMVLGVWLSRDSTHEMTLIPASGYGFQAPAGISADFSFALDVNGQVVVEPRLAGFAQVAGRTLTISGYRITLDGRALSHDLYPMVLGVWLSRDSTHEMTLIPASGYGFQAPAGISADFSFALDVNGQVVVEPRLAGFAQVAGRTLTISGYRITLDGRALSHDLYPMVLGVWLSRDSTHEMTLIPASGYGFQAPAGISADFSFALDVNGQVVVEPRLAGFAQVAGRTLTISGYRITLDGRALSHDLYPMVLGVWLSRDSTHEMTLIPASGYGFQAPAGISADFSFALDVNGQVVVEPRLAGFAQVAGRTLTISGYRITLDGRALSHDLYPMVLGVWLSRDSTHEMTLIPASGYGFQAPAGISADFSFALDVNGQVVVEPRLAGFTQVAGRTLTISGYRITLDGRALSHDLYPMVLGVWLSRDSTHEMTLIPASGYGFQAPAGISADFSFALDVNGQVVVEPRLAGFAQVAGRTLTISGYRITLDGRALSHDLYPTVLGVWLSRDRTHDLTLIPAAGYTLLSGGVADVIFTLDIEGRLLVDPLYGGFAHASGRTLIFHHHFGEIGEWSRFPQAIPIRGPGIIEKLGVVHAALLHTGIVLFITADETTLLWDPEDMTPASFQDPGNQPHTMPEGYSLLCSHHVFLSDGRLLVLGGGGYGPHEAARWGYNFDPKEKIWARTSNSMSEHKWYPTAVALGDRRVLVVCGHGTGEMDIYDEATDRFNRVELDEKPFPSLYPGLHLLPSHSIFYSRTGWGEAGAGGGPYRGDDQSAYFTLTAANTGVWTNIVPAMPSITDRTKGMSVMVLSSTPPYVQVLVFGGADPTTNDTYETIDASSLSPVSSWSAPVTFPDGEQRSLCSAVLLPDGNVFLSGGIQRTNSPCWLFHPRNNTWLPAAELPSVRDYHSVALLLPSGKVMMAGWQNPTIEVYSPPYLFHGPRPIIRSAPDVVRHGQRFEVETPDAESITKTVLVRPMAVTHQTDTEQRVIDLQFDRIGRDRLIAAAPDGGDPHSLAPRGYYMLFVLNREGVPSIAKWIRLISPSFEPGASTALAKQADDLLTAVFVDREGYFSVAYVEGTGLWKRPFRVGGPVGQPGAGVALAKQTDDILTAVFIDREGFFSVAHVAGTGAWNPPFRVGGPAGLPGAGVALAKQTDDILTAVFIDREGFFSVAHVAGTGAWNPPFRVGGPAGLPGAGVALAKQTDDILTAVFIDREGFFSVAHVAGTGAWNPPFRVGGPAGLPGAGVALAKQTDDILTAVFIDREGFFSVAHVAGTGAWNPPFRVGGPAGLPGAGVALAKQTDDILTAVFIDREGYFSVAYVEGTGLWKPPFRVGGPVGQPGGGVALAKQADDLLTAVFVDREGYFSVAYVEGTGLWKPPFRV